MVNVGGVKMVDFCDPETKDAIEESKQAYQMLNNATNDYRKQEAIHRIDAADSRIQAILYERRTNKP
jgi:hypothetical protein